VRLDLQSIRQAARTSRITWRYHALLRASERGISRTDALRVIQEGEIVEERADARPYPKCLMMREVAPGRPLYVAMAYDGKDERVYVITVHWLDPRKWEDPWTRKSKRTRTKRRSKP
jgi:hypothetical protein